MRISLIRREYITHLDGVNRFIALLYEAFEKLGQECVILSWGFYGVEKRELPEWFKEIHCTYKGMKEGEIRNPIGQTWLSGRKHLNSYSSITGSSL